MESHGVRPGRKLFALGVQALFLATLFSGITVTPEADAGVSPATKPGPQQHSVGAQTGVAHSTDASGGKSTTLDTRNQGSTGAATAGEVVAEVEGVVCPVLSQVDVKVNGQAAVNLR